MPPPFDITFRLGVGEVSDVISTEYGYQLFKVLEKKPARRRDFGEVRGQVEQKLLKWRRAEAQKEYVKSHKQSAEIHVNDPALAATSSNAAQH